MNNASSFVLTSALLLAPSFVSAHTHKVVMGTVKSIDAARMELTQKDGKVLSIPLAKSTLYMRGKDKVGANQVVVGMRIVVTLAEDDKTAEKVKLGSASKK